MTLGSGVSKKISHTLGPGSNLCYALHFNVFNENCQKTSAAQWIGQQASGTLTMGSNPRFADNFSFFLVLF